MPRLVQTLGACLLILTFLVPMGGYALGLFAGVSTTENRALAAWPQWGETADGGSGDALDPAQRYTEGINAHLSDRFGARMPLIRFARKIRDNLGEDAPLVVRGKGDWLFLGRESLRDEFEGQGPWTDADVDRWVEDILAAKAVFDARGIPFALSIAPDKARIMPEFLPDDWREGERRFRTRLLSDPRLAGIAYDAEPELLRRKAAGEDVYYLRDTHWSYSGGQPFVDGYLDLVDPQRTRPRYTPGPPERGSRDMLHDLEALLGETESSEPPALTIPKPRLLDYSVERFDEDGDGQWDRNQFHTKIMTYDNPDKATGTLVIVGDSFPDFVMPLFLPAFERVVKIHHGAERYDVGTDEILSYDPDVVLFLMVERDAFRKARPLVVGPTTSEAG